MAFPNRALEKYLARLADLIAEGEATPIREVSVPSGGNYITKETYYRSEKQVAPAAFVEWRTKCVTVLDQVIPNWSAHRKTVDGFGRLEARPSSLQSGVAFLKSIRADLRDGFFERLASEIETEINAAYMDQADALLSAYPRAGYTGSVVLAGAVLENGLRSICNGLSPAEPTTTPTGDAFTLGALIDALKRRSAINELTAKRLRSWAAVRNSAAHGRFDEFTPDDAHAMVSGVRAFLERTR